MSARALITSTAPRRPTIHKRSLTDSGPTYGSKVLSKPFRTPQRLQILHQDVNSRRSIPTVILPWLKASIRAEVFLVKNPPSIDPRRRADLDLTDYNLRPATRPRSTRMV